MTVAQSQHKHCDNSRTLETNKSKQIIMFLWMRITGAEAEAASWRSMLKLNPQEFRSNALFFFFLSDSTASFKQEVHWLFIYQRIFPSSIILLSLGGCLNDYFFVAAAEKCGSNFNLLFVMSIPHQVPKRNFYFPWSQTIWVACGTSVRCELYLSQTQRMWIILYLKNWKQMCVLPLSAVV